MLEIHGTADQNVPYNGGLGCGLSGVSTPSVADTVARRAALNGCSGRPFTNFVQGDGICTRQGKCPNGNEVDLCAISGGGHNWPDGLPPAIPGIGDCAFGHQSQTFSASRELWSFFVEHPPR
jgi:polyhydroxybutyrate depolymerase